MPVHDLVEQEIIESLIGLGFTERESRLYYALLRLPEATAAKLQHVSGVPRTKIYESLEALSLRGLCKMRRSGRTRFYQAVPPSEVSSLLSDQWHQELERKQTQSDIVFGKLRDFHCQQDGADPGLDAVEVIRSKTLIYRRYGSLVNAAEEEILGFVRTPISGNFKPGIRHSQDHAENDACNRGVVCRNVYRYEPDHLDWLCHNLSQHLELGEDFRIIKELPLKMFVFDARVSLLALPSVPGLSGSDFTMVVIADIGLATACKLLFETVWRQAKAIEEWDCDSDPIFTEACPLDTPSRDRLAAVITSKGDPS